MNWQELLGQSAWAATLILLAAFLAGWVLQAAPAAWRHFLWTAVLGALLMLPAVVRVMPKWGLEPAAPAAIVALTVSTTSIASVQSAPAPTQWNPWLLGWLAGFGLVAIRFLTGRIRTALLVRRATEAKYARSLMDSAGGRGIPVWESPDAHTAFAAGIVRPVVVLPAGAGSWPVERLRAALLHEWMHIYRRDLPAQAIAQIACCAYWFHPLAWLAARQLRREREQACDDAVLGRGIAAQEYAGHLVESARTMRGRRAGAIAMAEPSELEMRVRALLDGNRDRRPLNRFAAAATIAALALVLLPVAAITVHAQAPAAAVASEPAAAVPEAPVQQAAPPEGPRRRPTTRVQVAFAPQTAPAAAGFGVLSGIVQDPTGARIPGCSVTIRNDDGSIEQTTTADQAGGFQFASLPAGRYSVRVAARGFKMFTLPAFSVQANQNSSVNLNLELGGVTEAISVTAPRPATVPAAPAIAAPPPAGAKIRVGGNVQPAMLIFKVPPVYPEDMQAQGVSGTVHLAAVIDKLGNLAEVRSLGGPTGLINAATEAVKQWHYQPALLYGEPVQVITQIDITFSLE